MKINPVSNNLSCRARIIGIKPEISEIYNSSVIDIAEKTNIIRYLSDCAKRIEANEIDTKIKPLYNDNLSKITQLEITNDKFPNVTYTMDLDKPVVSDGKLGLMQEFLHRYTTSYLDSSWLQKHPEYNNYGKAPCCGVNNIYIDTKFLKYICELAFKNPTEVINMYGQNNAHWKNIAENIKGFQLFGKPELREEREEFARGYLDYITKKALDELG